MRCAIGFTLIVILLAAALPVTAQEDTCLQKGGVWNPDEGRCVIGVQMNITVHYPYEVAAYPFVEQAVDAFMAQQRAAFFEPIIEYGLFSAPGPLALEVDYELVSFAPSIMGIKFQIYEYTGGAHGLTTFKTLTFDLANERVLSLEDLFVPDSAPLDVIAPIVQDALRTQLGDMLDETWLEEGTVPDPLNYQNWLLTPEALVFYFPPYQVAAYAAGPQTASVPLSALADILDLRFTAAAP